MSPHPQTGLTAGLVASRMLRSLACLAASMAGRADAVRVRYPPASMDPANAAKVPTYTMWVWHSGSFKRERQANRCVVQTATRAFNRPDDQEALVRV